MAGTASSGDTLRTFVAGVMRAAEEISDEVVPVVLAVAGGILALAEPDSVALCEADDGAGGILWAGFGGERLAFRYNPRTGMIEMRAGTLDGHPRLRFGRRSLETDIVDFFGPTRAAHAARTRP